MSPAQGAPLSTLRQMTPGGGEGVLASAQALLALEVGLDIPLLLYLGFSSGLLSLGSYRLAECARLVRGAGVDGCAPPTAPCVF